MENEGGEKRKIILPDIVKRSFVEAIEQREEIQKKVADILAPHQDAFKRAAEMLAPVQKFAEGYKRTFDTLLPVIKEYQKFAETFKTAQMSILDEPLVIYRPPSNEEIIERTVKRALAARDKKEARVNPQEIFFSPHGDLYREPRKKYTYALRNAGKRKSIVERLVQTLETKGSDGYTETSDIAEYASYKNTQAAREAVAKINASARERLGIKKPLIEGRPGLGYRINPAFSIRRAEG